MRRDAILGVTTLFLLVSCSRGKKPAEVSPPAAAFEPVVTQDVPSPAEELRRWEMIVEGLPALSVETDMPDSLELGAAALTLYTSHPGVLGQDTPSASCVALLFEQEEQLWVAHLPSPEGESWRDLVELGTQLYSGRVREDVDEHGTVTNMSITSAPGLGHLIEVRSDRIRYGAVAVQVELTFHTEPYEHQCAGGSTRTCYQTTLLAETHPVGTPGVARGSSRSTGGSSACDCPPDQGQQLWAAASAYFSERTFWQLTDEVVLYRTPELCQAALSP